MQKVPASSSPFSFSVVVMMRVAALPPAKIGAPATAISIPMMGPPRRMIAATEPRTQQREITTTFHCRLISGKSIVVPRETIRIPAMRFPKPLIWASSISVRGKIPLQKPASRISAIPSTVEKIALVFWAMSSPAA